MFGLILFSMSILLTRVISDVPKRLGPVFVEEPPAAVRFAASSGGRVHCAARGQPPPRVAWFADDGSPIVDVPGIRRIYSNGTLEVFPSSAYRDETTLIRCRATNAHGTIVSRDVLLQPVADVNWEVTLTAEAAVAGGVAALQCRAGAAPATPALWYRGDRVLHVDPPTPESRYLVAGNTLLIRDVSTTDAGAYSCLARHHLTALTKRSSPAHLTVLPSSMSSAPQLVATAGEVAVAAGTQFCVPCVAPDYPAPQYTWYREKDGRLQPVEPSAGAWLWSGGAALCFARSSGDITGAWLCKAYNVFGDATVQLRIDVEDTFSVTVSPSVLVAEAGSTVQFNCSSSAVAALRWLHDGTPLSAGDTLELRRVSRAHAGAYQCVARRGRRQEQASAELRLGDSPPELQYTFIEQALRAGASVALRCAALAQPPPQIKWLLDGQPVDHYLAHHRFSISEESSPQGEVVSVLNVTAATAGDGGLYTCRASNPLGAIEHSARLNIYGPPSIRPMGIVRAVAGDNFTLHCPYAGYPISSVTWRRRGGAALGGEDARAGARGAALRLWPARTHDAGHYTCSAAAPSHPTAHRDVEIQVRNPPKISPFMFSSELTEGSSVQVLCGVSSGDKPMYFSWLKDGAPLPPNLQIEEKSLNEFSLLMFPELSARHSGAYTCRVANHAAAVDYTATLSVKVAPSWVTEPLDAAVLVGAPLRLTCAARGHPPPTVTWYRKTEGDGLEGIDNAEKWEVATFSSEWGSNGEGVTSSSGAGSSVLSAPAATRALAGRYRCSADNGVGAALVKHVNVSVHEPAHFEPLSDAVRNVSSVRGRSVVLSCLAMGDPPLTVHWTHRGNKLDLDSFRWSVSELRAGGGTRSSLRLAAAERGDAGEYRCHARNHYGRADQLILLHVEEPPEAPQRPRLGGAGSRWVRVSWRARTSPQTRYAALCAPADTPAPAALHTYNMTLDTAPRRRSDSEELELLSARLDGLKPASAYTLRIVATNHVGESPHSEALLFTTLEEAPSASPQSVRVRPINSEELHISWSAPSRDTWNGELLGYAISWREMGPPPEDIEEEGSGEPRVGTTVARGWSSAEMTVAGLRPWARYALAVRAFNRAGPGPPSPTAYATTADGVPSEAPSGVSCVAASARSLRVRWRAPALPQLRGYDVHYAPVHEAPTWGGEGGGAAARVTGGATSEALLQGLHAAANYSVRVRARSAAGAGPPSPPTYCATPHDVPGAPEAIRALPAGVDSVRVTWLPPADTGGQLTHYTVYTRELGKVGGEWTQRVDAGGETAEEMWRDVRGLREHAAYELWVRAASVAGEGPPSRAVSAAPAAPIAVRISSIGRLVTAALGARVRLRCSALGMPPLARVWSPLPQAHTVTDAGDLVIHKLDAQWAMNYTCAVRNGAGADVTQWAVRALRTPAAPSPRLARADSTALHLAWDPPHDGGAPLLGYTVWWWRAWELPSKSKEILSDEDAAGRQRRVAGAARGAALRGLACGAPYRVAVRAHNALGASPLSPALTLRTRGDKAKAPSGKECIWANATALRVSLLAWGGRCPVARWNIALRPAGAAPWTHLHADGDVAEVNNLEPGTWYEIRVEAHSPAGDSPALYKAATHTLNGERIGEPIDLPLEARLSAADEPGESYAVWWRGGAAALAGLALALGAAVATLAARRRTAPQTCAHPLYVAQPTHHNGKTVSPPDGSLNEISPYATFSMSEAEGERACGLHVRAARELPLAAPPPRPRLLAHPNDYGCARDSDSESSGSPCAACAAELYRLPAAHMSETLPVGAAESSTEDGSYAAGACAGAARRREAQARPRARRRDHTRPSPTVRYSPRRSLPREELRSNLL